MKLALKIVLPLVALGVGLGVMVMLVKSAPKAARKPQEARATLVEVMPADKTDEPVIIDGNGTVMAARALVLQPEIAGRVDSLHPGLVLGGRVTAGDELVHIDDTEYRLALKEQDGQIARAELEIKLERGRQAIAKREWKLVGSDVRQRGDEALALRKPQIQTARASLAAAKAMKQRLRLNVGRATIEAPFNAYVREEALEVGQLVGPSSRLATLIGTDQFWVEVALPMSTLHHLEIPGLSTGLARGSRATVTQRIGAGQVIERDGYVVRLLDEIEPSTRMARLLVAVDDPLRLAWPADTRGLPLMVGAFVAVRLEGRVMRDVFKVPRVALRDGDSLWTIDDASKLRIKPVNVAWRDEHDVIVKTGVSAGERIVTSRLATPVEGMALRVSEASERAADTAQTEPRMPGEAAREMP